jgi:SHS2 domain-containing protein
MPEDAPGAPGPSAADGAPPVALGPPAAGGGQPGEAGSPAGSRRAAAAGHRILPHTADLALEAWAKGKYDCIAEAARALVESFAEVRTAAPADSVTLTMAAATDEDLLVAVLDEVIYQAEVRGRLPADIWIGQSGSGPGHAEVRLAVTPASQAELSGAVPKAVSRHELRFIRTGGLWRCHVIVDI